MWDVQYPPLVHCVHVYWIMILCTILSSLLFLHTDPCLVMVVSPADFSDYKEHKITEDNVGFKMLQKAGWTEGAGLGATGEGITAPINK